jgi:hypothetical protein
MMMKPVDSTGLENPVNWSVFQFKFILKGYNV